MLFLKVMDQVYGAFSTPIFQADMPGMDSLNDELSGYLLNERLKDGAENEFDWSTKPDLHNRGVQAIDSVVAMFGNAIAHLTRLCVDMDIPKEHMGISADVWGTMTRAGSVKSALNYAPLHWRGLYFVRSPQKTVIEIASPFPPNPIPGTGKYRNIPRKLTLEPHTSTAIVFPGNLTHNIIYSPGDGLNIALEIAGTVVLDDKEVKA
jgi:hypothetical protein